MFRLPTTVVALTELIVAICWAVIVAVAVDAAVLAYFFSKW